ncbi:hypothetical protein [Photobacterium minamisatsumaniensis]|uniref:hypothetical protein n=1 Tax=Photobacterium minamisatsumaniensis TaxID=2910233 RepID=UPI003D15195F
MTYTLRTTWIIVFSIIAMLMSSYVSSAPSMVTKMLCFGQESMTHHCSSDMADCHSMTEMTSQHSHTSSDIALISNSDTCTDSSDMVHNCCSTVCFSVFYPMQLPQALSELSYSLALYQSFTIGDKVARTQTLLRPPSA